jgi:hypothetical protein
MAKLEVFNLKVRFSIVSSSRIDPGLQPVDYALDVPRRGT